MRESGNYKELWTIITELTSIYSDISGYSSVTDFETKSTFGTNWNNQFDKTYTNYKNNKDKIWELLNKFFKN
ncbi:hypothetical protein [Mycoplasma feriruminatoris]|uniref:hypothetical protein n=1 Tax=Mycoplasma feriruminatoris TaxID=1179777 RepID=UPI00241DBDC7|nr:hypothetical protein [Mycoplasma feriruminatoris]